MLRYNISDKYSIQQNADELRTFFHKNAYVNWHCSNEHFTVEEYIQANCEYPGEWCGEIERIEIIEELTSFPKSIDIHMAVSSKVLILHHL